MARKVTVYYITALMLTDKYNAKGETRYLDGSVRTAWHSFIKDKTKARAFGSQDEVTHKLRQVKADNKNTLHDMEFNILMEEHNESPIMPDEDDKLSAYMAARKASRNQ
jgi:hypothetical protein